MAESKTTGAFPLTISFRRDSLDKTFRNRKQLNEWRAVEQQYWQSMFGGTSDPQGNAINQNAQLLNGLATDDDAALLSRVTSVSENYLPSEGGFCRVINRLRDSDPNAARLALWIFLTPQNVQMQN